jgi:nucleotide-binding universal stress UspA family protein
VVPQGTRLVHAGMDRRGKLPSGDEARLSRTPDDGFYPISLLGEGQCRDAADMHESIVARFDGSPEGYEAVAGAAEHAFRFNARLISLSVEEGLPKHASTMAEVDEVKRERDRYFAGVQPYAEAIACEHHAALTSEVRPGRLADATARFVAEVDADLVVLGYKRHLRFLSLFIGTTARE